MVYFKSPPCFRLHCYTRQPRFQGRSYYCAFFATLIRYGKCWLLQMPKTNGRTALKDGTVWACKPEEANMPDLKHCRAGIAFPSEGVSLEQRPGFWGYPCVHDHSREWGQYHKAARTPTSSVQSLVPPVAVASKMIWIDILARTEQRTESVPSSILEDARQVHSSKMFVFPPTSA